MRQNRETKKTTQAPGLAFGGNPLANPFVLAPMAGCTDLPFRLLCREFGASLCYSEMVSAETLLRSPALAENLLKTDVREQPVVIQLYGGDPQIMGEAAALISSLPIAAIDINMGCPMKKIIAEGAGAALMNNLPRAEKIMTQVCRKSHKPVTVKMRSGWNHNTITAPALAKIAQTTGVQAIAVHARTWTDGFSGAIDEDLLKQIKKSLDIPVIGNGEIRSHDEGTAFMQRTGCDAVMIGRAALGAPWIFSSRINPFPSTLFRINTLKKHLALIEEYSSPQEDLAKIRNHAWKYFRGLSSARTIRGRIESAATYLQIKDFVAELFDRHANEPSRK